MASNQPGKCCTVGVKHEGTATGEVKTIGETRTYFAYPENKSTQNAILILTDIMGIDSLNPQLIADQLAANGYFVVMPDLFHGDAFQMNASWDDLPKWLTGHTVSSIDPVVEATLKEMRGPLGCKRIGGIGYCFGAKYVCRFLKPGMIDAGFVAHPSFVDEDELRGIKGPLSIAAAETDSIFPAEKRHRSEEILAEIKAAYQITLYSGVEHGFSVRGDLNNRQIKFAKEQAFFQAVTWFDWHIKNAPQDPAVPAL